MHRSQHPARTRTKAVFSERCTSCRAPIMTLGRLVNASALRLGLGASLLVGVAVACTSGETSSMSPAAPLMGEDGGAAPEEDASPAPTEDGTAANPGADTGIACTGVGVDTMSVPTPGRCAADVAETCDPETRTLRRQTCGPSAACRTFDLEERKRDLKTAAPSVFTRKIPWAACVPKDAAPCSFAFTTEWSVVEKPEKTCDGDTRLSCTVPNLPAYPPPTSDGLQLSAFSRTGWRMPSPCPSGETCRVALNEDFTACFAKTAPPCTPGTSQASCVGAQVRTCDELFGYAPTLSCGSGESCQSACNGEFGCAPTGAATCDPAVKPTACATPTSHVVCPSYACRQETESCATVPVIVGGASTNVPGRCAVVHGEPRCVRTTDVLCDESTFVDRCDGANAVRCVDGLERPWDCSSTGESCAVAGGHAGCRASSAPACAAGSHCDASAVVACCPAAGYSPIMETSTTPCVPGYETRVDCAKAMRMCKPFGAGAAYCNL